MVAAASQCRECGGVVKPTHWSGQVYCSRACSHKERMRLAAARRPPRPPPRFCVDCSSPVSVFAKRCPPCVSAFSYWWDKRGPRVCLSCSTPLPTELRWARRCEPCKRALAAARKRTARAARKAKERAARTERFDPLEILERDGWRCYLCGVHTPRSQRGSYLRTAPEIDHLVPLAKGGVHSRANTACACRACNLAKSDKLAA